MATCFSNVLAMAVSMAEWAPFTLLSNVPMAVPSTTGAFYLETKHWYYKKYAIYDTRIPNHIFQTPNLKGSVLSKG